MSAGIEELVLVKLGGSLITDKSRPYTVRQQVIDRLCREIHQARADRPMRLVLGHGGGSFPHLSAQRYQTHRGVVDEQSWRGFTEVHEDARRLNAIVCQALRDAGEPAVPMPAAAACVARDGTIVDWSLDAAARLLDAGLVVVPFGDVCVDEQRGCCVVSTEEILRYLSRRWRAVQVVLVGKVDGVFDAAGQLVPEVSRESLPGLRQALAGSDGVADVTGGMLRKVELALEMAAPAELINGGQPDRLRRALLGQRGLGTRID